MATETGVRIPGWARRILHKKSFAHVATVSPDGSPHVTPACVDVEDDEIVINTPEAGIKPNDLVHDPRVAIAAVDPDNPQDAVIVRGHVTEMSREPFSEARNALVGAEDDPADEPGERRVTVHVEPDHVTMPDQ